MPVWERAVQDSIIYIDHRLSSSHQQYQTPPTVSSEVLESTGFMRQLIRPIVQSVTARMTVLQRNYASNSSTHPPDAPWMWEVAVGLQVLSTLVELLLLQINNIHASGLARADTTEGRVGCVRLALYYAALGAVYDSICTTVYSVNIKSVLGYKGGVLSHQSRVQECAIGGAAGGVSGGGLLDMVFHYLATVCSVLQYEEQGGSNSSNSNSNNNSGSSSRDWSGWLSKQRVYKLCSLYLPTIQSSSTSSNSTGVNTHTNTTSTTNQGYILEGVCFQIQRAGFGQLCTAGVTAAMYYIHVYSRYIVTEGTELQLPELLVHYIELLNREGALGLLSLACLPQV